MSDMSGDIVERVIQISSENESEELLQKVQAAVQKPDFDLDSQSVRGEINQGIEHLDFDNYYMSSQKKDSYARSSTVIINKTNENALDV